MLLTGVDNDFLPDSEFASIPPGDRRDFAGGHSLHQSL
jgi:hypothetical protein